MGLPFERTDEAKEKRRELFKQFDPNGNGYLSLAETDKGVRDVLGRDELFDCKPAINRAFHFAKDKSTGDDKHGPDFLEFREFRLFLQTLRQYFEYFQAFDTIDKNGGGQILFAEFVDWALSKNLDLEDDE